MNDQTKKIILLLAAVIIIAALAFLAFFWLKSDFSLKQSEPEDKSLVSAPASDNRELEGLIDSSRLIGGLPISHERIGVNFSNSEDNNLIEYISFLDFYNPIEDNFVSASLEYQLPLNVKTEVVNYYDFSRKINLDQSLDSLNRQGLALIDNVLTAGNFYDIYDELYRKQIPLLITSDFLVYHYQQTLKEIFKNVEKNIFYSNLWDINEYLYLKAKSRYEENLRAIGNVNDRVLEAQRLAAAYFAVSLELLKPDISQIDTSGQFQDSSLFNLFELENYSFSLPDYLKVDVEKEVALIKEARSATKSPVLLYQRDYRGFAVPEEYKNNSKLHNFYLATEWLSSNFPLYYKNGDCPDCQLDFDDWRVSFISSSLIAQDLFNDYELKNNWARIYKTLAFFKGLRGDLTYVHYRDALTILFGENYEIGEIFSDHNPDVLANLHRFRDKILEYEFLPLAGALDKSDKKELGVKMLTEFYWPNDYLLNQLSYPNVSNYQGGLPAKNNITACKISSLDHRCNGFSLDIIALADEADLSSNDYYLENSKYKDYDRQISSLKSQISQFPNIWHYNNYWKTLNMIKKYLASQSNEKLAYTANADWRKQELSSAVGFWINLQLPTDDLGVYQKYQDQSVIDGEAAFIDYNYIEPNLDLVNEQLANVNMIIDMFKLLKISDELKSVGADLENLKNNLNQVKGIMIKELSRQDLDGSDTRFISLFSRAYKLNRGGNKILSIAGANNKTIKYDLSRPKLKIIAVQSQAENFFAIGPVFSYAESR